MPPRSTKAARQKRDQHPQLMINDRIETICLERLLTRSSRRNFVRTVYTCTTFSQRVDQMAGFAAAQQQERARNRRIVTLRARAARKTNSHNGLAAAGRSSAACPLGSVAPLRTARTGHRALDLNAAAQSFEADLPFGFYRCCTIDCSQLLAIQTKPPPHTRGLT